MTEVLAATDRCDSIVFSPFNMQRGPWSVRERGARVLRRHCVASAAQQKDEKDHLRETFMRLANAWREETWFVSSLKKKISHPDYLKIIGLGPDAIQFLLADQADSGGYWSWALEAITRQDPAPDAKTMHQLRDAWLAWGRSNGYSC